MIAPRRAALGATALLALLAAPLPAADAKVRVSILGWSTEALASSPQAQDKGTIKQCLDMGNGQRSLRAIVRGRGIEKNRKVGIAVWGGPPRAGFTTEPTTAEVTKNAFKWPVGETKTSIQPYGFSIAMGPFGPIDLNGLWNVKVIIGGKVVARGRVTVAC